MKKILIPILLSSSFFSINTYAEETGNFYLGLGLGQIDVDLGSGISTDKDNPIKFYAGYKFHPNYAVELQHLSSDIDVKGSAASGTLDFKSTGISLVSTLPINPSFSFLGKIGYAKNKTTATVPGKSLSADDSGLFYGFGAQYNIISNFTIRGEYESLGSDASLLTIGANYTF